MSQTNSNATARLGEEWFVSWMPVEKQDWNARNLGAWFKSERKAARKNKTKSRMAKHKNETDALGRYASIERIEERCVPFAKSRNSTRKQSKTV